MDQGKVIGGGNLPRSVKRDMGTCRKTYGNIVGKKTMGIRKKIMRCIINNWNPTRKKTFFKTEWFLGSFHLVTYSVTLVEKSSGCWSRRSSKMYLPKRPPKGPYGPWLILHLFMNLGPICWAFCYLSCISRKIGHYLIHIWDNFY